ncbi:LOW QUALITY PROTEIN: protein mono-ADP-ribosyltransferase PARP9 [Anableps anableps]
MEVNVDFPLYGPSVNIVKQSGDALCEVLHDKFGCVATIQGVGLENESRTSYQRPAATIRPEKRFEFTLRSRVKVSVWKADLTNFNADAVVNAANEDLHHYGGLALALSKAGGPQIQKESDDYVRKRGKLKTGDAVVMDSGSLPCKKIIHAVGPQLSMNHQYEVQKAKPLLEKAIKSILNRVGEYHLATVAIPAISSGLFNYPLPECAHTIVSTIKSYYDNPHRPVPQEIFLANHDEPTVQEMEKACHQIFCPQQHQSYSHAVAKNTRSAANTTKPSVHIGNVVLRLKKGNIEDQHTDVIVNTASEDLELRTGISKAILKKAGYEMQSEIKTAKKLRHIVCTKPYKLFCKEVYHTSCIKKGNSPGSERILFNSVLECLCEAASNNHSSIAFPAIGTGALEFSGADSSRIMLKAVTQFASTYQYHLQFPLSFFPSEDKIFQAFENEMRNRQKGLQTSFEHASGPREDFHSSRDLTPKISLLCPSDESKCEAEKWLRDRLSMRSDSVEIDNNFISYFSEEDHLKLALFKRRGLIMEEFFAQGHACLTVKGKSEGDAVIAALQVEAILCQIHTFILEEKNQLQVLTGMKVSGRKKTVEKKSHEFSERIRPFRSNGPWIVNVVKVENDALKAMFDMKKRQLRCSTSETMFQRIPPQFCEMISQIGFHAECAPPEDPEYGEGIYFARNIRKALELWKWKGEQYLYFVEAEVLVGNSTKGERGLILPPSLEKDSSATYDSVNGGPDVTVIFSGYQALPKYIIICKKD